MNENKKRCDCLNGVGCEVSNCIYNDVSASLCTADHIKVKNASSSSKTEAACETFSPKSSI